MGTAENKTRGPGPRDPTYSQLWVGGEKRNFSEEEEEEERGLPFSSHKKCGLQLPGKKKGKKKKKEASRGGLKHFFAF